MMKDEPYKYKDIPLNGKWKPAFKNGILMGENDFQTLLNMRYTATHKRAVAGNTKAIATPVDATYYKVRSAAPFDKTSPDGKYICAQAFNMAESASELYYSLNTSGTYGAFTSLYSTLGTRIGTWADAPNGNKIFCNGTYSLIWGGLEEPIAKAINYDANTTSTFWNDITKYIINDNNDADSRVALYASSDVGTTTNIYIGCTKKVKGFYIGVTTPNTVANTLTLSYWNASSAWAAVASVTDGTRVAGKTLAQSGWITFTSTVATESPTMIGDNYLYWYKFSLDNCDETTVINYISCVADMQPVTDLWDGVDRPASQVYFYKATSTIYKDYTTNAAERDCEFIYSSGWLILPETVVTISGMTGDDELLIGSTEPLIGVRLTFASSSYISSWYEQVNTAAATIAVYYWNGTTQAWTACPNVVDGTIGIPGAMFSKTGVVSWDGISSTLEFPTKVSSSTPLYYYKIKVATGTIDANTRIDQIRCIPAPKTISGYNVAVMWLDALWMAGNVSNDVPNEVINSGAFMPSVWNGLECTSRQIGSRKPFVAGCTVANTYSTGVQESMILCKTDETYEFTGSKIDDVTWKRISSDYGCIAPQTMKTMDLGFEVAPGVNKTVALWLSNSGIVMYDHGSIKYISWDIKNFFDDRDSSVGDRINPDYVYRAAAFVDRQRFEYHFCFYDGAGRWRELVYDVMNSGWFEIDRGYLIADSNNLRNGVSSYDSLGNHETYGFDSTGYLQLLESGVTFDGNHIHAILRTGDKISAPTQMVTTEIRHVNVMTKSLNTNDTITVNHYLDTAVTPSVIGTISQYDVTRAVVTTKMSIVKKGVYHGFGFSGILDNLAEGFEPLNIAYAYRTVGENF